MLTNSTLPQLLTKIIVTDVNAIGQLKKDIATESYIKEWHLLNVPISNVTSIDNRLKQALFANWILETDDFQKIKTKYKTLANPSNITVGKAKKISHYVVANHNVTLVKEKFQLTPFNVRVNETRQATVFVPRNLQLALFDEWPQKEKVVLLLGKFAKDMDLSPVVISNGTQLVLAPTEPSSSKGQPNADYRYVKYGMYF